MKIKINRTTYEIKFVDKLSNGNGKWDGQVHFDGRDNSGYTKKRRNMIEIVKGEHKEHILFHEIVHILFSELSASKPHLKRLSDKCNNDENFVDGLAFLMMDCFEVKEIWKKN